MNNAIAALSGLELLALGREARQIPGYMDYGIICKIEEVIKCTESLFIHFCGQGGSAIHRPEGRLC